MLLLLLIGGGVLGNPAPIAEQRRAELVWLVAHNVDRLDARFLTFGSSWTRLFHLGLLLGHYRAGGREEGVVADGGRSTDAG